jgi:putative chitinase
MKLQDLANGKKITFSQLKVDNDLVAQCQVRLWDMSYDVGVVDGILGSRTERELQQFCKDQHLDTFLTTQEPVFGQTFAKRMIETKSRPAIVTRAQAEYVYGSTIGNGLMADLNACLARFRINTTPRIRHFLSQTAHESGGLQWMEELASGIDYEGRGDLGNTHPGDGPRYKGRGVIQMTGRANYKRFSEAMNDPDILVNPVVVAIKYPFSSAGFWWTDNNMNSLCDSGASVERITRAVNGGYNGLEERRHYYQLACQVIP